MLLFSVLFLILLLMPPLLFFDISPHYAAYCHFDVISPLTMPADYYAAYALMLHAGAMPCYFAAAATCHTLFICCHATLHMIVHYYY